jgi:TRAP-type C4-dicarboxylate transport system permease small subunit
VADRGEATEGAGAAVDDSPSPFLGRVEKALGAAAAFVLFAIMTVTVVDVVGRYALNAPLHGGYEMIQVGMAFLVFFMVPVLTMRDGDIRIEIFQTILPERVRPALQLVSTAISLVVIVGFCWFLLRRGMSFVSSGETTSTLRVPLAPLAFFIAASWAASAAAATMRLFSLLRGSRYGRES